MQKTNIVENVSTCQCLQWHDQRQENYKSTTIKKKKRAIQKIENSNHRALCQVRTDLNHIFLRTFRALITVPRYALAIFLMPA